MDLSPIYAWVDAHKDECVEELRRLIRQPSIAAQDKGVKECADLLVSMMKPLGIDARTYSAGGQPFVYGSLVSGAAGAKTLAVYNHYDVQPPEPLEDWEYEPFAATLVGDRIVARGATDSKGNLMAHLMAVRAYREVFGDVPVNVKYVFDGEEEISSPTIDSFVDEHRDILSADAGLSLDGGFEASNRPRVQFGSSGLLYIEIQTTGSSQGDLHSARARLVESAAWKAIWIAASMKDRSENITIAGFSDAVTGPSPEERAMLEAGGWDDAKQMAGLGVDRFLTGVTGVDANQRLLYTPTCNVSGLHTGYAGAGSKTVLPSKAVLKMDFRLVPRQDPYDIFAKVKAHVEALGIDGVELKMLGAIPPSYAPLDSEIARAVIDAARAVYPQGPSLAPRGDASGKQGPWLATKLGVAGVSSSVGPPNWRGHAPNEFITIGHFLDGIKYVATIYANYAGAAAGRPGSPGR
jgi:acetylornithine deacetylase/succinyl-diaminopimelate desuccinylase-like protein